MSGQASSQLRLHVWVSLSVTNLARSVFVIYLCSSLLVACISGCSDSIESHIEALKDGNHEMRQAAADALRQMGPEAKAAVPALLKLLNNQQVRRHADYVLGGIGEAVVPQLVQAFLDQDQNVRQAADDTLGRIGTPAVPRLIEALKNENAIVRGYAAHVLGPMRLRAKAAVPQLIEVASKDEDKDVRANAGFALAKIDTDARTVAPYLIEALKR